MTEPKMPERTVFAVDLDGVAQETKPSTQLVERFADATGRLLDLVEKTKPEEKRP